MQAICNGDYKFEPVSLALLDRAEQVGRVLGGCFGHCQAIRQVLLDYRPIQSTYLGSAIEPLLAQRRCFHSKCGSLAQRQVRVQCQKDM